MAGQGAARNGRTGRVPVVSRYATAVGTRPRAGYYTLDETERAVSDRIAALPLDMPAMAAVQNVYRAAAAIRNHLERTVLAPHGLTWTGWVVLWVVWIWGDIESRHVAAEASISKATLTGVATTLEGRGLLARRAHPEDGRRVLLALTPEGQRLMEALFPQFNEQESLVVRQLDVDEQRVLTQALRKMIEQVQGAEPERSPEAAGS